MPFDGSAPAISCVLETVRAHPERNSLACTRSKEVVQSTWDSPREQKGAIHLQKLPSSTYRMAIEIVLKSSVAAAEPELAVLVARLLGFDRLRNDLESSISAQVQTLIGNAHIESRAGNYSLVQN